MSLEYKATIIAAGQPPKPETVERELNSLAERGWELVELLPLQPAVSAFGGLLAVFKRPRSDRTSRAKAKQE
jgi:hypothetical protein